MRKLVKTQTLSLHELKAIQQNLKIIRNDSNNKIKVASANGSIYKFFYDLRKSWLKKKLKSAGVQFANNALRLQKMNIHSINPSALYFCKEEACHLVVYGKLPGDSVYELVYGQNRIDVLHKLAKYIAELHSKSIYFRAGHCDNYLYDTNKEQFSIIDVDNLRFSLGIRRRAKNIFYLFHHSYRKGSPIFSKYSFSQFLSVYLAEADLNSLQLMQFGFWFNRYLVQAGYAKISINSSRVEEDSLAFITMSSQEISSS